MPLRRLTRRQFDNTVKDIFGNAAEGTTDFPETALRDGFRTFADLNTVTADSAGSVASAAAEVAKRATANLSALLGCSPGASADDDCLAAYVTRLTRQAYRRPAEDAELTTLKGLYAELRGAGFSAQEGIAGVIEAVLQSPQFLYLGEVGQQPDAEAGAVAPLSDHEIAARISYFLWDTKPDDQLSQLADEGKLHEAETLEAEVRRLLDSERAQPLLAQFVDDWLHLHRLEGQNKDGARYPEWNTDLKNAMRSGLAAFVNEVAFRADGKLETLLGASFTMANEPLAKIYGGQMNGGGFARLDLNPGQRKGIITSAAFLTAHAGFNESFPVLRGAWVRKHMLCQEVTPPANVVIELPPADPNVRGRERFAQHREDPVCSGCHALMDPIGFGLENYDALGRYRTKEGNDLEIDASGELLDAGEDISGPFVGGVELGARLAQSQMARDCVAQQLFSYAVARGATEEDDCALRFVKDRFTASGGSLKELIVSIALSDAFGYRRMPERAP